MENGQQLANRFREVMLNGKWIANTNFQDRLSDVSLDQATQKIGSLNTIAILTFHVNYYIAGLVNVFKGGELDIRDKFSFDMPELTAEQDWASLTKDLYKHSEEFATYVEKMSNEQLEAPFVDEKYGSYRRNIEAMIEHSYYHLGQVSLIKKLVLERA